MDDRGTSGAARTTAAVLGLLGGLQALLAAGAPWGAAAYGGQNPGRLPGRLRGVSAIAAVLYATGAGVLLRGSGSRRARRWLLTGLMVVFGAGTPLNAVSRSPAERVWSPVCALGATAAWRARTELRDAP